MSVYFQRDSYEVLSLTVENVDTSTPDDATTSHQNENRLEIFIERSLNVTCARDLEGQTCLCSLYSSGDASKLRENRK